MNRYNIPSPPVNTGTNFEKLSNHSPWTNFLVKSPGPGSPCTLNFITDYIFLPFFKTLIIDLPTGYVQIREENINL